jgi:sensor histidine kinase regulating citrate/malate metabolism
MTAASSTFICIYGSYTHQYTFIPGVSNSVVLIIAFAFIIILMLEEMAERSRGEQLYYYETYIPIIDQMIKGVQLTQHSYNNQIMSLTGIIESDMDKDEMRSAIKNLTGQSVNATRADYHFLHLENRLLAGMLYQKVKHAEELGYNLDFTIRKYSCESEMSDFDIVDITGILIDNAIEHSEDGAKDIYVTVGQPIKSESSKYYIKVENAGPVVSEESINNMFKKGHTSKSDKSGHGLGMYILKDKVNKCKGKVTVSNTTRNDVRMIAVEVEV